MSLNGFKKNPCIRYMRTRGIINQILPILGARIDSYKQETLSEGNWDNSPIDRYTV